MTKSLTASLGLFWGLIFESFLAPYFGVYLFPTMLATAIFVFLPLRLNLINALAGWLAGVLFLSILVIWILDWRLFSFNFFLHEIFYFSVLIAMLYAAHANFKT